MAHVLHHAGRPLATTSNVEIDTLVARTDNSSGADVANVVDEAVMLAIREYIGKATGTEEGIGDVQTYQLDARHLEEALSKMGPKTDFDLTKYKTFVEDKAYQ